MTTSDALQMETERYVLRAAALPEYADDVQALIPDAAMFAHPAHEKTYRAILSLVTGGRSVDRVSVHAELARLGLDTASGLGPTPEFLDNLFSDATLTVEVLNYATHAEFVREQWARRSIRQAGLELQQTSSDPESDIGEAVNIYRLKLELIGDGAARNALEPMADVAARSTALLHERATRAVKDSRISGIKSGIETLDLYTGGFHAPHYGVIGARTSLGKSALLKTYTHGALSLDPPEPVLYLGGEEPPEVILIQLACIRAEVSTYDALHGGLPHDQRRLLNDALEFLKRAPLRIVAAQRRDDRELRSIARRAQREMGAHTVCADYVQRLGVRHPRESKLEQVSRMSNCFAECAQDFNQIWHIASQCNRGAESREAHMPLMSDLKEAGTLEEDADMVTLIHRPEFYGDKYFDSEMRESCLDRAKLIIAKCRNNETRPGGLLVGFNKLTASFRDDDPDPNPQQRLEEVF